MGTNATLYSHVWRRQITIPANTEVTRAATQLLKLLRVAGYEGPQTGVVVKILAYASDGTSRAAFVAATPLVRSGDVGGGDLGAADFTTHGQYVPAAEDFSEPLDDLTETYLRSASGSTVAADVVAIY